MNWVVKVGCCAVLGTAIAGCGPQLRRADLDSSVVERERSEQLRLAKEVRQKREQRLNAVAERLAPQARILCQELLSRTPSDCTYQYELIEGNTLNAAADGKTVYLYTGMMRFVESEDELAVIVGHEIAHNMLGHLNQRRGAAIVGAIIDGVIAGTTGVNTGGAFSKVAANVYSREYEAEADYLGVYLAERAGYDITVAPDLWRRMGIEHTDSIAARYGATHPSTPERSVALSAAIEEIGIKNIQNLALVPNRLDGKSEPITEQGSEAIANQPPHSNREVTTFSDSTGAATGRYIVAEPPPVGKWAFVAEEYALDSGCSGENGGRPRTELKENAQYYERYASSCADGSVLEFRCELGGCFR